MHAGTPTTSITSDHIQSSNQPQIFRAQNSPENDEASSFSRDDAASSSSLQGRGGRALTASRSASAKMSTLLNRLEAKKQRIAELRRAREALHSAKADGNNDSRSVTPTEGLEDGRHRSASSRMASTSSPTQSVTGSPPHEWKQAGTTSSAFSTSSSAFSALSQAPSSSSVAAAAAVAGVTSAVASGSGSAAQHSVPSTPLSADPHDDFVTRGRSQSVLSRISNETASDNPRSATTTSGVSEIMTTARVTALTSELDTLRAELEGLQSRYKTSLTLKAQVEEELHAAKIAAAQRDMEMRLLQDETTSKDKLISELEHRVALAKNPAREPADASPERLESPMERELRAQLRRLEMSTEFERQNFEDRMSEVTHRLDTTTRELDAANEQLTAVREMLLGGVSSSELLPEALDISQLREAYELQQQEIEQYEGLLAESLSQVETLRSQLSRSSNTQHYLDGTLADFEEENKQLNEQLAKLKDKYADSFRATDNMQKELHVATTRMVELETQLETRTNLLNQTKADLETTAAALSETKSLLEEARTTRAAVQQHNEELAQKVDEVAAEKRKLQENLTTVCREVEQREQDMREEVTRFKQQAQTATEQLDAMIKTSELEIEAARLGAQDQHHELSDLTQELQLSRMENQQIQENLNNALQALKSQLAESHSNMESAALAGLGLTEMVDALRHEKERALRDLQQSIDAQLAAKAQELAAKDGELAALQAAKDQAEASLRASLQDVQHELDGRNQMLTGVMEYLQGLEAAAGGAKSGAAGTGEEGDESGFGDLRTRLERAASDRRALERSLADLEGELTRTGAASKTLQQERQALLDRLQQADARIASQSRDLDAANAGLASKTEMLTKVMEFLKANGITFDGAGLGDKNRDLDGLEDEAHAGAGSGGRGEAGLAQLAEHLEAIRRQREELEAQVAAQTAELAALNKTHREALQSLQDQQDELQGRGRELEEAQRRNGSLDEALRKAELEREHLTQSLSELRGQHASLQAELASMTEERDRLQGDMDALRRELEAVSGDMRAAAQAGLSLTELLAQVKADYEARIADLQAQIVDLQQEVEKYRQGLQQLMDFLPKDKDGNGEMNMDLLEELRQRLQRALQHNAELEKALSALDHDGAASAKAVEDLMAQLAKLRADNRDLQARLDEALKELKGYQGDKEKMRSGIEGVVALTRGEKREDEALQQSSLYAELSKLGLQQLLDQLAGYMARITQLEQQLAASQAEATASQSTIKALNQKVVDLTDEQEASRAALRKKEQEYDDAVKRIADLNARVRELLNDIENLKNAIAELNRKLNDKTTALESLFAVHEQEAKTIADHSGNKELIQQLSQRIMDLEKELNIIRHQLEQEREKFADHFLRVWQRDTNDCSKCHTDFTFLVRRHHCRLCGLVFCSSCTKDRVRTAANKNPVRVCRACFDFLRNTAMEKTMRASTPEIDPGTPMAQEREVTLDRGPSMQSLGIDFGMKPFGSSARGSRVSVRSVVPNSLAALSGVIKAGDLVVRLNDQDTRFLERGQVAEILKTSSKIKLTLVENNDGETPAIRALTGQRDFWLSQVKQSADSEGDSSCESFESDSKLGGRQGETLRAD
eukprot:m.147420 g.147420  ORF g.147420 m.147420 type:complete len:1599 (+) comp16828_c0_seq3:141-4937(+)